jgi:hypothetical protein
MARRCRTFKAHAGNKKRLSVLKSKAQTRYKLDFPSGLSEASVELRCYLIGHSPPDGGLGAHNHLKNAIQALWPENFGSGKVGYCWHEWMERRCHDFCYEPELILWGAGATGKSTDIGILYLADWYAAPDKTTSIVCSTTLPMLNRRIFGEIVRYHRMNYGRVPGEYRATKHSIVLGDENSKNGIFGFAVLQGSVEQARDNIIGQHNERVRLCIDECQSTREAAVAARSNLEKGARDFRFHALGNPLSWLDPLGNLSIPRSGNTEEITPEKESWRTKTGGLCTFYDGRKSPAIRDSIRLHFLITARDIARSAEKEGEDSPDYWQFTIGFIAPEGMLNTVLSDSLIMKHEAMKRAEWGEAFVWMSGLDPSYSSGGNRCMYQAAKYGLFTSGVYGVEFQPPIRIKLRAGGSEAITDQIVKRVDQLNRSMGIEPKNFACDTTGSQVTLGDAIEAKIGKGIHRVDSSSRPTTRPVSIRDSTPSNEKYGNLVTELWFAMNQFVINGQIRGLDREGAIEFCSRMIIPGRPMRLESKREMKKRTANVSPDNADAKCVIIDMVRSRFQLGTRARTPKENRKRDTMFSRFDIDARAGNYLSSDLV